MKTALAVVVLAALAVPVQEASVASAAAPTLFVCHHGCRYSSVQSAVDAAPAHATVRVRPGTYAGGVLVRGHRKDGLTIVGTGARPRQVILDGRNTRSAASADGIEAAGVDGLRVENLWVRGFAADGVAVRDCRGYLMQQLVASRNAAHGLSATGCTGGRMTRSTSYGHPGSGFYVAATPRGSARARVRLDHLLAYGNAVGYLGENSSYVDVQDGEFRSNGTGLVISSSESAPGGPATSGQVEDNLVYWNNLDPYRKGSGLGQSPHSVGGFHYPTGTGVVLLGTIRWLVRRNRILGNWKWGAASFGDPTSASGRADVDNAFRSDTMGAAGTDPNGTDFFTVGDGHGTCWADNSRAATFDPSPTRDQAALYSPCTSPSPPGAGPDDTQLAELEMYVSQTTGQESSWHRHSHPRRPKALRASRG